MIEFLERLRTAGLGIVIPIAILAITVAAAPQIRADVSLFNSTPGAKALVAFLELSFAISVMLAWRMRFPDIGKPPRTIVVVFLSWLAWSTLSAALSSYWAPALVRHAEWLIHLIFLFYVSTFLRLYPKWQWPVLLAALGGFIFFTRDLPLHMVRSATTGGLTWDWVPMGFANIRHAGYYATAIFMLSLAPVFESGGPRLSMRSAFCFVSGVLASTLLFASGGRGPFLAIGGAAVFLLVTGALTPRGRLRLVGYIGAALIAGLLLSLLLGAGHAGAAGTAGAARIGDLSQIEDLNKYSSGRTDIWMAALAIARNHLAFGLGPDGFMFVAPKTYLEIIQPHNLALQMLVDWGIPGAILFSVLLLYLVALAIGRLGSNTAARTEPAVAGLGAFMALLALSMVDGALYHPHASMLAAFGLGLALSSIVPNSGTNERRTQSGLRILVTTMIIAGLAIFSLHTRSMLILNGELPPSPDHPSVMALRNFPSALTKAKARKRLHFWATVWKSRGHSIDPQWFTWVDTNTREERASWMLRQNKTNRTTVDPK